MDAVKVWSFLHMFDGAQYFLYCIKLKKKYSMLVGKCFQNTFKVMNKVL